MDKYTTPNSLNSGPCDSYTVSTNKDNFSNFLSFVYFLEEFLAWLVFRGLPTPPEASSQSCVGEASKSDIEAIFLAAWEALEWEAQKALG